jgi:1-acyl-sn-glycerol-3-phosphate acyltransferase
VTAIYRDSICPPVLPIVAAAAFQRSLVEMEASRRLLDLVAALRDELRAGAVGLPPVKLDSRLDRDLGFDSLARAELLLRIETEFAVRLPAELLSDAETPQDFLTALGHSVAVPPAPTFEGEMPTEEGQPAPEALATLAAVLQWHAAHQPERTHLIHLDAGETPAPMTYGRLWNEARAVVAALQARGIAPGDAVALMLPTCPEFFPCFCGILLAGAVPVPIYPPARPREIEDHLRRHAAILANAGAKLLIADARVALPARLLLGQVEGLAGVEMAETLLNEQATPVAVPARADDLALLQYTSGSTGVPKGVTLTHAQLLANIHAMARAAKVGRDDVFVSWLPLYHDMGLICAWLSSLTYALPFVVMSPLAFLARPVRWLHAIQRYRGTLSGAPNFAYELCLKRIPDAELAGLDLSSWRIAFNGAEPVSADTMTRFTARFAACGLRPAALAPVYGLAECAVGLALTPGRGARIDTIRRADFALRGEAVPADEAGNDGDAMRFVLCGRPLPGYAIRVVDEAGAELPERREGRIQFRGPSATAGYFRNPEATARLIRDGWWETGDRGYLLDGEIVPSGRVKDIIIKAGRNLHPQEIEQAVGAVAGIRKGCVAAFGSPDPATGSERLVVMAELSPGADENAARGAAQAAVVAVAGLPADEVVLSTRRIVLKTSSGKVRRAASRELYERGMKDIAAAPRAVWLQVARLALSGALPQVRRGLRALGDRLAGYWAAGLFCLFAGPVWLITAVSPAPTFAWRFCGFAARLWMRLSGIRTDVRGLEDLPPTPCVLVANHASYLDGLALVAVLPWRNWRFVAKRELRANFFARVFLERLGCDFVERFDFRQGVADAERLHDSVAAGHAPVFFPEGTFSRVPGLAPFRMGAFMVAARNGVPVVPVAIAGARDRLRDGHWLPRRGALTVSCQPPILPDPEDKGDWHAALRLRDAARAAILRHCGEGDLQA